MISRISTTSAPGTACELRPEVTTKVLSALQTRVHDRSLNEAESSSLWTPALQAFVHTALTRLATGLSALPPTLTDAQADSVPSVPGLILG